MSNVNQGALIAKLAPAERSNNYTSIYVLKWTWSMEEAECTLDKNGRGVI